MKSIMVVASLHQLMSIDGKFTEENKKCIRTRTVIARSFAERFNESKSMSGKMYVIDEEATEEYNANAVIINAERKENEAVSKETSNLLKDVVKQGMQATSTRKQAK